MNLVESEVFLKSVLKDRIDTDKIDSSGTLIFELHSRFAFDVLDIYNILYNCPALLSKNTFAVLNNIVCLGESLNLKDLEVKYLVLKMPFLLMINADILKYKLQLISTTYGCSIRDAIKILYQVPELITITKSFVLSQNNIFSKVLNEYGLKYRTILRSEPKLLFATKDQIEECKKYLMQNFTLTEEESECVLINSPSIIVLGKENLIKKFESYYPSYFIKRDLKEMLSYCPEFLLLDEQKLINKIKSIQESFGMDLKKACDFVRLEPKNLFFDVVPLRVKNFMRLNVSMNYVLSSPKLGMATEISVPLKFIITRILSLDERFSDICEMDTNLFISRFLFMQAYGYYDHSDLLSTEEIFYEKYHISTRVLKLSYRLDYDFLRNICEYYINSREKMKGWSDVVFPEWNDILSYINGGFAKEQNTSLNYLKFRETKLYSRRQYEIYIILKNLKLSDQEITYIFNKNKFLNKYVGIDMLKIIQELKKYEYSQEQIIKLMMKKQYLFNYNIRDFVNLVEQISATEKCTCWEAIEKYM